MVEARGENKSSTSKIQPDQLPGELKSRFEKYSRGVQFKAGQIVRWKKGLKNRRYPEEGEPVVVIEMLQEPVFPHDAASGSAYFREPLNMICGRLNPESDEFYFFHYDSRRFEVVE